MAGPQLINVSVKCEYALRAILDLAIVASSDPVRIADIAARRQIPQKFLETILSDLRKQGFLDSRRGAEGGYLLARPAETITLGEVVRAVEGSRGAAPAEPGPLDFLWVQVDTAIAGVLDRRNFADLAREWRERQSQHVPNWEI